MQKIKVLNPIVEMDGDEMTRIMWQIIKDKLILPYLDIELEYYDLGLQNRDNTEDQVTIDAANAIKKHMVGVKCATITPDKNRIAEYNLKKEWKSPNATIRAALDGTVFRKPIVLNNIPPVVSSWKKPIIIGRHAYGDLYKNSEMNVPAGAKAELLVTNQDGAETKQLVQEFKDAGIIQGIHNTENSIRSFAKACINLALSEKVDIWFGTKDTISKTYHATFKKIFQEEIDARKSDLEGTGISYFYSLIDDTIARIMRHEGGMLWACMNYEGDVFSDMIASGFGSLGLMTSVLVSPEGYFEYEAAHGTVQKHYYKHLKGEATSTNSTASIFAWTGAIRKRGELDGTPDVVAFAEKLEQAVIRTIESGIMTGDLTRMALGETTQVGTEEFIDAVARIL